jgi:methyl-accepting chemotaxis protein
MAHENSNLEELVSTLKQQRDELALKIHLAAAEARAEWEQATDKLDQLTEQYDPTKKAVAESAEAVSESLKLVAGEVLSSFNRIRKSL